MDRPEQTSCEHTAERTESESQQSAADDTAGIVGDEEEKLSSIAATATDGLDEDFAAAAAAAEEATKSAQSAQSAQSAKLAEASVLHLAEIIGIKVAEVLKTLVAAKLSANGSSSATRSSGSVAAEPDRISVFPPEAAPEPGAGPKADDEFAGCQGAEQSSSVSARSFQLLLQVKGMKGTGLAQLWKQRPALEALERLQLLFSASLLAWCKGELPSPATCTLLESYGCNLARIEEGGLPAGWRCIFRAAPAGDGRGSETETDEVVGFWYCHGRSGRATRSRPRAESAAESEQQAADAHVAVTELESVHQDGEDSTSSGHPSLQPAPPPPPLSIDEQTWQPDDDEARGGIGAQQGNLGQTPAEELNSNQGTGRSASLGSPKARARARAKRQVQARGGWRRAGWARWWRSGLQRKQSLWVHLMRMTMLMAAPIMRLRRRRRHGNECVSSKSGASLPSEIQTHETTLIFSRCSSTGEPG